MTFASFWNWSAFAASLPPFLWRMLAHFEWRPATVG